MGDLTKNFSLIEFLCKCGHCVAPQDAFLRYKKLAQILEVNLRQPLERPILIKSALRCPPHNKNVGGALNSRHLPKYMDAVDLAVDGISSEFLCGWIESRIAAGLMPQGGLGLYKAYPNIIHYDTRGTRARWFK